MADEQAFTLLLRRTLLVALTILPLVATTYLLLVRQNRARSYDHGMAAIEQARQHWPALNNEITALGNSAASDETIRSGSPEGLTKLNRSLDRIRMKQRERIVLSNGVKVHVYARVEFRTNSIALIPMPGTANTTRTVEDLWLPSTVEIIAAQQDLAVADFLAGGKRSTWELDPLEFESILNSKPGVISWALMVSAPGGFERTIAWTGHLLLIISSFLILFVPAYVWHDARGRYRRAGVWTAVSAVGNLAGLLAYLLAGRVPATACRECAQPIGDHHRYCPFCRAHLKNECANCGRALAPNWHFCPHCSARSKN